MKATNILRKEHEGHITCEDFYFDNVKTETVSGLREFLNQYARFATGNAKYVSAQVVKNAEDRLA